jgi:hypothetical protein
LVSLIPSIEIRGFPRLSFTPADVIVRQTLRQKEDTESLPLTPTPGGGAVSDMRGESDRCSCGVALEGRLGQAYNEQAFRYFLAIERKRSERSGCPFLLLLVDLKEQSGVSVRIDPMVAPKLFSALWLCLRETDCIGWYREERVAGALVPELGDRHPTEVCRLVGQRVSGMLREGLPADVAPRVQVRVYQHAESGRFDSVLGLS